MENLKPWETEPDYLNWIDANTGYACVIKRNPTTGALCGYVRLPGGHLDKLSSVTDVHGGITFAGGLHSLSGETLEGFYIGFDCAHHGDFLPEYDKTKGVYRDFAYVRSEVESMARQLAKFK
jgi:hypothetical protein